MLPKVIALDLDGTVWDPEMYQLPGGAPFTYKNHSLLVDRSGMEVYLHTGVFACFEMAKANNILLAIASSTDEPKWARECLEAFHLPHSSQRQSLASHLDLVEIYYGNKQRHLDEIRKKAGVEFRDILFIDNQMDNIRHCTKLGVPSFYTPNGLTIEAWRAALEFFAKQ